MGVSRKSVKGNSANSRNSSLTEFADGTAINDENWRCIVTMLIESRNELLPLTSLLHEACKNGCRKSIHSIDREKVVNDLQASSTAKTTTASDTRIGRVDKVVAGGIDASPSDAELARLIKSVIHEAREASLARSAAALQAEEARARELWELGLCPGGPTAKGIFTSRLPRRGQHCQACDRLYLDDAPLGGPDCYILLTGFREPGLPVELIKLGVPLNCILKLENPEASVDSGGAEESSSSLGCSFSEAASSSSRACSLFLSSPEASQRAEADGCANFWRKFDPDKAIRGLIVRSFCPGWTLDADPNLLYDDTSYALYDVHETLQAHADYLKSMRLMRIEEPRPPSLITSSYEALVNSLPEECLSPSLLLEALLRQVEVNLTADNLADQGEATSVESDFEEEEEEEEPLGASKRLSLKLALLNLKHGLGIGEEPRSEELRAGVASTTAPPSRQSVLELILHGDAERLNARRSSNDSGNNNNNHDETRLQPLDKSLASFELLEEPPWIAEAWKAARENEVEMCKEHMSGIYEQCKKRGIDSCQARHLLNLLKFAQLFECLQEKRSNKLDNGELRDSEQAVGKTDEEEEAAAKPGEHSEISSERLLRDEEFSKNDGNFKINELAAEQSRRILFDELIKVAAVVAGASTQQDENRKAVLNARSKKRSTAGAPGEYRINNFCIMEEQENKRRVNFHAGSWSADTGSFLESQDVSSLAVLEQQQAGSLADEPPEVKLRFFDACFGALAERKSKLAPGLEQFQLAEIIGARALPQILRECAGESEGRMILRHFGPSDSLLLLLSSHQPRSRCVAHAIRTPVCLRDFCEYVMAEETEWLSRWRAARPPVRRETDCRALAAGDPGPSCYREEDYLLPGSLKAQLAELAKPKDDSTLPGARAAEARKERSEDSLASQQRQEQHFDFLGYELGERRVDLSNFEQMYEARDGLHLRLVRENWLLGDGTRARRTSVRLRQRALPSPEPWQLWYQVEQKPGKNGQIGHSSGMFHLTTPTGAIVAFARADQNFNDQSCDKSCSNAMLYSFQVSRASGLIIKPVEYRDENRSSFYILQRHTNSKEPTTIKDELCRKYLQNGDVVKYFNDGTVVVLRPNATVITLLTINRSEYKDNMDEEEEGSSRFSCNSELLGECYEGELCSCSEPSQSLGERLRYRVLELDGRQYEIADGRLVRQLEPLRSSLAEEYHPLEKFARREDGTEALFNQHAELIVSFPDGTRLMSGCIVEEEPAECDWSADELERFFGSEEPQGFVSVLTYGRAEHPDYVPVQRYPSESPNECPSCCCCCYCCDMSIEAADELHLQLRSNGLSELRLCDRVRIKLEEDKVTLRRASCCSRNCCGESSSEAIFHLAPQKPLMTFRDDTSWLSVSREAGAFEAAAASSGSSEGAATGRAAGAPRPADWGHCRLIALARDGQAHEYRDRSAWEAREERMAEEDERSSLICWSVHKRPGLERRIALASPIIAGLSTYSPINYKIPEAKPSPSCYLRQVGDDGSWDGPFKVDLSTMTARLPSLMIATLIKPIARPDEKALLQVQQAILDYRQELASKLAVDVKVQQQEQKVEQSEGDKGGEEEDEEECLMCDCQGDMESRMMDIAADRANSIDSKIYEIGRQYLRKLKVERDEKRTIQMIDRVYTSTSKCEINNLRYS